MKNEKTKKSNLKPVRQNKEKKSTKSTAKKETKKPAKEPTKKVAPKVTASKTTKTTAPKEKRFILRKDGFDKEGNQKFKAIRVYERKPNGWKVNEGATTAPVGYQWINNGKSLFGGKRKSGLLKLKDK